MAELKLGSITAIVISEAFETLSHQYVERGTDSVGPGHADRGKSVHLSFTLKRKCRHCDGIFITDCTGSCRFDNCQCSQWWQFYENVISVSLYAHTDTWCRIRNMHLHFMLFLPTEIVMTSSNGNIFRVTILAICAGNSPVPGEFPAQRPVTRRFDVFFDLRLNNRLSKYSWGWWFETLWRPLWRQCNEWYRLFIPFLVLNSDLHILQKQ